MHPEAENFLRFLIKIGDFRFQIFAFHTEPFIETHVTFLEIGMPTKFRMAGIPVWWQQWLQ